MADMWKFLLIAVVTVVVVVTSVSCENVVVLEHEETTLTCDISPTVPRTSPVFWYSNSLLEYLTSDDSLIVELRDAAPALYHRLSVEGSVRRGRYSLRIVDVRAEDAGDYVCGYYRNDDEWITVKTVTIEVLVPPGREFPACSAGSPTDTLLLPGMLVNLSCISYGGSPRADLAWYRDDVALDSAVAHDGLWVYHQRIIQEEDSGVQFTCQATSAALPEPKNCSIVPYRRAPLLYIEHDQGGVITLGNSATFTCTNHEAPTPASGDDKAQYRWYFNGEPAEESRAGLVMESGRSLVLDNLTSQDDKAVVTCEKVDEFTARSSASMTILVLSSAHPMLYGEKDSTSSEGLTSTPAPSLSVTQTGLAMCIFGAICFGMFFMLFLILITRLFCNIARKRGQLDFNTKHEITVGWQKCLNNSRFHEVRQDSITITNKPTRNSQVLTFKKPNGVVANGNHPTSDCAECLRCSNMNVDVETLYPVASSNRSAARLSRQSRNAVSQDILSGSSSRNRPPPLSLFNETTAPLLSSPSPIPTVGGRRLPSADRDYTASMPDLASRYYGERRAMTLPTDHDYVNLPAPSSKENSGNTTPSSYVNCEFVSPMPPPTSPVKSSKSALGTNQKSLSYAELDLPRSRERPTTPATPVTPVSSGGSKGRAGSVSVERTKYAEITYVFKDRRQQSLPSVKLVGLSEGFGERV